MHIMNSNGDTGTQSQAVSLMASAIKRQLSSSVSKAKSRRKRTGYKSKNENAYSPTGNELFISQCNSSSAANTSIEKSKYIAKAFNDSF
jgi:hypothetical protein